MSKSEFAAFRPQMRELRGECPIPSSGDNSGFGSIVNRVRVRVGTLDRKAVRHLLCHLHLQARW